MNDCRLLDRHGGVSTYMHMDALGEGVHVIHDTWETEPIARELKFATERPGKMEFGRQERIIPPWVMDRAYREGWLHDQRAWRRWANGEEGRRFGVEHNGKVNTL